MRSVMATRVTARESGFLVERLCDGVVIDRYKTRDLKEPRRNKSDWIQRVGEWFPGEHNAEEVTK